MRRIVVGAMARSGSTWTYNALRLLASEVVGPEKVCASDDPKAVYAQPGVEVEINKILDINLPWQPKDIVITCVRDLRDAFCSAVGAGMLEVAAYPRTGLSDGVCDGIRILLSGPSRAWAPVATMVVRYERMVISKLDTLRGLGKCVFPDHVFDSEWLERTAIELEVLPELYDEYDPEQGYLYGAGRHRQHVGVGGYRTRMDYADQQDFEAEFAEWFEYFNYPVDDFVYGRIV